MRGERLRRRVGALLATVLCAAGLVGCTPTGGSTNDSYTIAGGGKSGVYYNYGDQLAIQAQRALGLDIEVTQTEGSVDNILRVSSGEALVGFSQGDTAADAIAGTGAFSAPQPIAAVARVYDEYVHVVVPADSQIHQISDLAGHTVSLGAANSGVQVIANRVLAAAGVEPSEVPGPALGLDASLVRLRTGQIEAFFWVGGLPTPGIERLAEEMPIRLLPLKPDTVEQVNASHAGVYRTADFPAGAYGVDIETPTMTVPNYLIASADAPPQLIREVLGVLFESQATISDKVRAAAFLDRRQAIFTEPMPLHPGAAKYYIDERR
ncbi:TAXI family TRAP transporter solute-binding subunit [Leucobacter exalbidus]|nr:TAXI family TRAP transporter solute-binding subunit [Leucobacter exalbidus]